MLKYKLRRLLYYSCVIVRRPVVLIRINLRTSLIRRDELTDLLWHQLPFDMPGKQISQWVYIRTCGKEKEGSTSFDNSSSCI